MRYIDKLYPLTKLYFAIFFITSTLLYYNYFFSMAILATLILVSFTNGNGLKILKKTIKSLWILVLLLFIIQGLFFQKGNYDIHFFSIGFKSMGITYAFNLSLLLIIVCFSLFLLFDTTSIKALTFSFEQKGMNKKVAYVLIATFQIFPELKKNTRKIILAQQSRGLNIHGNLFQRGRSFLPVLNTLFLNSFISSEERSLTLESKGFSIQNVKTSLYFIKDSIVDRNLRVILVLFFIVEIIGRFLI